MGGGRAKISVLFFFSYDHQNIKNIFFVNYYSLVMVYQGLVSI